MPYILYINQKEKVSQVSLPAGDNMEISMPLCGCTADMAVYDDVWKIMASENISLSVTGEKVSEAELSDGAVITLIPNGKEPFAVIVKEILAEKGKYEKYAIDGRDIRIGRAEDNDIIIDDRHVGSYHCMISKGILRDKSSNGTYVNGVPVKGETALHMLDEIYIAGHRLIFLGSALGVCCGDSTRVHLQPADTGAMEGKDIYGEEGFFSRSPRRIEPLDRETVEIEDPPAKQRMRSQPLLFIIGPSVTMPIPILVSVLVNIASNAGGGRSGVMYLGTALSVVLSAVIGTGWALAHQVYNKKQAAADEKERTEGYLAYIENNREALEDKHRKNKEILKKSYLSSEELITAADNTELLWNRNRFQSDFLTIRLGTGKVPLPGGIAVSKQRFSLNDDELCSYPHELRDKYEMMEGCVSLLSIPEHKLIGMTGDTERLPGIVCSMAVQLAALHCYTDVKIGFIAREEDREKYAWARWLPHCFMGGETRLAGFDEGSRKNVIYELAAQLERREEAVSGREERQGLMLPHLVIFCTSEELMGSSSLGRYMSSGVYLGVTFVLIYGSLNMLPNECRAVIECSEDFSGFYMLDGEIGEENRIEFDMTSPGEAERFARKISGRYVSEESVGSIPQSVRYLEMLGIGRFSQWDLIRRYKVSRSYEGIRALIGTGRGGVPVCLDIHEKKDGPHGLVAGTTGSGKSEMLQTFILSVAMNYSPDDAAFVLIDYKGGGMANAFEGLPHIAGMLTNISDESGDGIDVNITRRMCSSLYSEKRRRQAVFKKYGVNNIDDYSRLYRSGKANEAMPHLIIISDEFAELKREQPDFIKELVSLAAVGRSLGIHLILATQKPAGVVDDLIWSNSRFRICLRVQDKQDSTGMIKRPDAAYITNAGRAFLQIGNDEMFEEFQSGWSGGKYSPKDSFVSAADSETVMIGTDGSSAVVQSRTEEDGIAPTELEAAVKFISRCAEENHIAPAARLWLPPLGREIFPEDIMEDNAGGGLRLAYGLADDYERQRQYPCVIDLMGCSNLKICGTAGSGKTTLLQTLLCQAAEKYSPEEIIFYVMDFSSRTFKLFKRLPHCGGVVYEGDDEELSRLISLICETREERKALFEREEIGSFGEYKRKHSLPLVLLVIDGLMAFSEGYENYSETVMGIMHEGVRYGIQTVVTVNNSSEIKYKMRSYLINSIVLRMGEKSEYGEFLGRNPGFVPAAVPGRGLTVSGGSIVEFQAALPVRGSSEYERSENMRELFGQIAEKFGNTPCAKGLPVIPKGVRYSDILPEGQPDFLPTGYNTDTAEICSIPFSEIFCFCVSGGGYGEVGLFMDNISEYCDRYGIALKAVRLNDNIGISLPEGCEVFSGASGIRTLTENLQKEFAGRNAAVPRWKEQQDISRDSFMAREFGRIFVIIDDMTEFCNILHGADVGIDYADVMTEFFEKGKGHGIYFFAGFCSQKKTYLAASGKFKAENRGIHLGGAVTDQNVLEINIPMMQRFKELDSNRGYCVTEKGAIPIFVPER